MTKQLDYGTCRVESASEYSLATGVWFYLLQCHLMVGTWLRVMKMAQSWCGIFQVAAALHLWWVIPHAYGHWLSGGYSFCSPYYEFHIEWKLSFRYWCTTVHVLSLKYSLVVNYSGEGSLLASGSADCTVKLWDVTASTKLPKAEEKWVGFPKLFFPCFDTLLKKENVV